MRLSQLVLRNLSQHRISSGLTALNVMLGALLVGVILLLRAATADTFLGPSRGFSLVVGAPGSGLELVLNTIFHLGQSPGLLDYDVFEELERHPSTQLAVPYAVGDAFHGFRVVGTTEAFFEPRFPYPAADTPAGKLAAGRPFHFDRQALRAALGALVEPPRVATSHPEGPVAGSAVDEAVLGADVARSLDVRLGDRIEPTHGVEGGGSAHRERHLWQVVGILRPTHTPVDGLVLINLDSFFRIGDHRGGVVPETGKPAISAVVLFPKPGVHKALLLSQLNKRTQLQVADVDGEVRQLLRIIGNVDQIFFVIAILVVLVGVVSVAVAIYNTLSSRRRELAILRILGASRGTIFGMVVGEATLISALGGALGFLGAHGVVWAGGAWIEHSAGFRPTAGFLSEELIAYVLVVAAGALGGLLPAFRAYRNDAAAHLAPLA
jgi:putative ABC transport system permease protein